jgi:hypothetical protein
MDLAQHKLNKTEWESIEIPEKETEQIILKMIIDGYSDINISIPQIFSLRSYFKIEASSEEYSNCIESYIYNTYYANKVAEIQKEFKQQSDEYLFLEKIKPKTKLEVKRGDKIRFQNDIKEPVFEDILLQELLLFVTTKKDKHYFTIDKLLKNNIKSTNKFVLKIIHYFLEYEPNIEDIVFHSNEYIEKNEILTKYSNITLYDHQKLLFTYTQKEGSKLIFYIAPTGTGKTLSPLALSKNYKIIFVCAARHVGLSLAKACITMGKKIAFAFGCQTPEDIRLHYSAAKDFVKDRRSGGIFRVDNSVGDKVEIIISDLQSYLPSMYYMLAFNSPENILLYWDEPTISLDYPEHPLHETIKRNWSNNIIPNIVLSSATLPKASEVQETTTDFIRKFSGDIYTADSYDCKKTIPLINMTGGIVLPHLLTRDYNRLQECVNHCITHPVILRYFELHSISTFIEDVQKGGYLDARFFVNRRFTCLKDVNVKNIKMHYLNILQNINEEYWETIYDIYHAEKDSQYAVMVTTRDAHTLTDGPTIFLTENVKKIAQFCIQQADIPQKIMDDIMKTIEFNTEANSRITILEKKIEDLQNKDEVDNSDKKTKKKEKNDAKGVSAIKQELTMIQQLIKPIFLNNIFIPNTIEHLRKWASGVSGNPFTSSIDELTVIRIMALSVDYSWKVLLLIGVGVFTKDLDIDYTEIMKQLAVEQKLFLIIADSDYIYGTNYQFCHGYLSKDLTMTQDKILQALGRIGRNNMNSEYSVRFRKQEHIDTLFYPNVRPEVTLMNKLFC